MATQQVTWWLFMGKLVLFFGWIVGGEEAQHHVNFGDSARWHSSCGIN